MEWITVPQLASLLGVTARSVRKSISSEKYTVKRQIDSRGGASGKAWEIHITDPAIPADIRQRLGVGQPKREIKKIDEEKKMSILGEVTTKSKERASIVHEAQHPAPGFGRTEWVTRIARKYGLSRPTLFRWIAEARKGKFSRQRVEQTVVVAAEAGPLSLKITSRSFSPQAAEFGLSMLLSYPTMNVKEVYTQMEEKAQEEGWDIGSLQTFYRLTQQLPAPVTAYARCGARGMEALIKPAILRDFSKYHVYEVLVGDQHIFDYAVMTEDGSIIRPQMFAWADFRSRYFSGIWPVMGSYDKYAVGFALREACRWGIPKSLYTDWGKPEGSGHIQAIRRQLDGLTACMGWEDDATGLPQKKAKPRNAQAKPIESWFYHALERPLLNRHLPGYCRRDRDEKRNEFITENLRKETRGQKLLPAQAFFEIVLATFEAWHNHVMVEEKIVPAQVFEDGIHDAPIMHFDDATLDFLFLPAERRQVRNSTVQATIAGHGKVTWYAPELSALSRTGRRKETVELRFDPYDPEVAYILDIHTQQRICIAERWHKEDPHDMPVISEKIRQQNRLMKWWKNITTTLVKEVERKVHRISPYTQAATEIQDIDTMRNAKVINREAFDRKLISLAEERANARLQQIANQ